MFPCIQNVFHSATKRLLDIPPSAFDQWQPPFLSSILEYIHKYAIGKTRKIHNNIKSINVIKIIKSLLGNSNSYFKALCLTPMKRLLFKTTYLTLDASECPLYTMVSLLGVLCGKTWLPALLRCILSSWCFKDTLILHNTLDSDAIVHIEGGRKGLLAIT